MVENDYPVPSYLAEVFSKPDGWVETPKADPDAVAMPGAHSVYAIDCEMVRALSCVLRIVYLQRQCLQCLTEDGKALTRVCIIDFVTNKVVKDQLVKPPSPITDYLTRCVLTTHDYTRFFAR